MSAVYWNDILKHRMLFIWKHVVRDMVSSKFEPVTYITTYEVPQNIYSKLSKYSEAEVSEYRVSK